MRINELAHQHTTELDALIDGTLMLDSFGYGISTEKQIGACFYYPIAMGNPFQSLYYSSFIENGIIPIGTNNLENLVNLRWPGKMVLHLHWLGNIIGDAETNEIADVRINLFLNQIDAMKENGFKIIWTVHNILPHDAILQDLQIKLRVELVKRCDAIHTMSNDTPEISEAFFTIPKNKIIQIPHPTYSSYYPNQSSRLESRYQLGLEADEFVFLFFGSIQDYKGLKDLVRAFTILQKVTDRKIRLIIAGKVYNQSSFESIKDEIDSNQDIMLVQKRIDDKDVQHFFKAADICVCPYRITLNSGVAHLSHTFLTPVIGPNVGGFKDLISQGGGLLFEKLNNDDLLEKMKNSMDLDLEQQRKIISKLNIQYQPNEISSNMVNEIRGGLI